MFDQTSALGRVLGFGGGIAVLGTLAIILGVGPADAQLTGGARVYFEKGGCNQCHGRNGNGVGDDARERGANFRESALDKETIVMIVSCGIPGTNMPYFDKFSYTDDRCYGMTEADVGKNKPQIPIANFLAKREIDLVADYILENFVGKGPVDPNAPAAPATAAPPPAAH